MKSVWGRSEGEGRMGEYGEGEQSGGGNIIMQEKNSRGGGVGVVT